MKLVSGSCADDWFDLVPGDVVHTSAKFRATWPADGHRRMVDGLWRPALTGSVIHPGSPFTVISHIRRSPRTLTEWYKSTWTIIMHRGNLWWVGTSTSGSLM